mgnify:FL=1
MTIKIRSELVEAAKDYKYLIDRGYPIKESLDLVVKRYFLSNIERMILYRCIHPSNVVETIASKVIKPEEVYGQTLLVDGFNVLITVVTAFDGGQVFLSDDGLLRDVSKSIKKFSFNVEKHLEKLRLIIREACSLTPSNIIFFYDKQVSYSGEIASLTRSLGEELRYKINTIVSSRNDKTIITYSQQGIVSSSDIVILLKSKKIFDLAQYIIAKWKPHSIVDIKGLIR